MAKKQSKTFTWTKTLVPKKNNPDPTMARLRNYKEVKPSKLNSKEEYDRTAAWGTKPTSKAKQCKS